MMKSVAVALTLSACASITLPSSAAAQVAQSGYDLPLALALEAATTAIEACEAKGMAGLGVCGGYFRRR